MKVLFGFLSLVVLLPYSAVLNGWVLTKLWAWFVIPPFGLPQLSVIIPNRAIFLHADPVANNANSGIRISPIAGSFLIEWDGTGFLREVDPNNIGITLAEYGPLPVQQQQGSPTAPLGASTEGAVMAKTVSWPEKGQSFMQSTTITKTGEETHRMTMRATGRRCAVQVSAITSDNPATSNTKFRKYGCEVRNAAGIVLANKAVGGQDLMWTVGQKESKPGAAKLVLLDEGTYDFTYYTGTDKGRIPTNGNFAEVHVHYRVDL